MSLSVILLCMVYVGLLEQLLCMLQVEPIPIDSPYRQFSTI